MRASVRALLEHLIDYAGMFPPARLPMRDALAEYTRLSASPEAWMLGRFVCGVGGLAELLAVAQADGAPPRLSVSVLGRSGKDVDELSANLDADLRAIAAVCDDADVLEIALPADLESDQIMGFVDRIASPIQAAAMRGFLEVPISVNWQSTVVALSDAIARRHSTPDAVPPLGLKIRCGGAVIPTVAQLAFFIARCRDTGVPWKATAGLHQPLFHRDSIQGPVAHGFVNVFAAGILSREQPIAEPRIAEILEETGLAAFTFTPDEFGWCDWRCSVTAMRDARRWIPSFGSCSFDEPRDGLRTLGLIG